MASAVATLEPQIAAKSVQATTVTRPSEPCRLPNQAVARLTSARATPPRRMKAAAMTKSGSAISVAELSSSMIFWAMPTSGWPLIQKRIEAQTPSTRKIGIPAASRPKKSRRNSAVHTSCCRPRRPAIREGRCRRWSSAPDPSGSSSGAGG